MKIQYMSDLHMEFAENSRYLKHKEFPVTGDVLVLLSEKRCGPTGQVLEMCIDKLSPGTYCSRQPRLLWSL